MRREEIYPLRRDPSSAEHPSHPRHHPQKSNISHPPHPAYTLAIMSEDTKPSDLDELIPLAQALIAAAQTSPLSQISALLEKGAPAWYQDEDLGWSCLHYAAERREPAVLEALIKGGAVWNAVDKWGRTAGEVCLSLGDQEGWEIIRNEGIRSGMSSISTRQHRPCHGRMTLWSIILCS